jgi:hypothetical protein
LVEIGQVVSDKEMSSNGQNCSILSQNVPKFELYEHNDELFNIYYGIFYELQNRQKFKVDEKSYIIC